MAQSKNLEHKKRQLSPNEAQSLLKEEILQLQKELEGQTVVRSALEKALNCQPLCYNPTYESLSQPAENLIKEIALLELEVEYLEKYLLSLYRRSFTKRLSTLQAVDKRPKPNVETHKRTFSEVPKTNLASVREDSVISCSTLENTTDMFTKERNDIFEEEQLYDSGICRSQSSLSQHSACSFRVSPSFESLARGVDSYHSLPLWMLERAEDATAHANSAEYLGSEAPNYLSEEMIKCISTIYCHLSDPPLFNHGFNSVSLLSPPTTFSPQAQHGKCSEENTSFGSWMNNPFNVEESKEFNGSLYSMVEVQGLLRDSQSLDSVEELLQNYRFLISKLGEVDPGKLKHDEKLAFWINVHNSLVMHAFLVYGIPQGNMKRISLALKAAYNVGGHTISVDTIQSSILRCRLPRPSQWLQSLFFPKQKFKACDPRKVYAIRHSEPRLRFALCSGCNSDAPVRIYTSKKVFQELEIAKEEYIQMNVSVHKEQRLLVPKNVEYYAKEMGLSPQGIAEMLQHSMPDSLRKNFSHNYQGKLWKKIDYVPQNFTFRFLLTNELVR
uniref:Putative ternary complex factor MIP1 n=1 Tax=Antirrhinum majus TaxID=4151 RepID=Q84U02_ANTMA|nr:putative ternary complex factor MIP1 [Antirrhinum majus]